jgi:hypothetical protein
MLLNILNDEQFSQLRKEKRLMFRQYYYVLTYQNINSYLKEEL